MFSKKYVKSSTFKDINQNVTRVSCKAVLLLLSANTFAQESTAVLPQGIRRTRAVTVTSFGVESAFNDSGDRVGLLNKLNVSIPAETQAAANPDLKNLYDKLNQVEPGLGDKLLHRPPPPFFA